MANLKNVITIQQGANWLFSVNIFDDVIYKNLMLDFLDTYKNMYSTGTKTALELTLAIDAEQSVMKLIVENTLSEVMTYDMQTQLNAIFEEVTAVSLLDKEVKIHLAIFKASNSNRTIPFSYIGTTSAEGAVEFNIPANETFKMIHKTNREHKDLLLGYYTIELTDLITNNIIRLLEGDCIISRGAKNDCIIQAEA